MLRLSVLGLSSLQYVEVNFELAKPSINIIYYLQHNWTKLILILAISKITFNKIKYIFSMTEIQTKHNVLFY